MSRLDTRSLPATAPRRRPGRPAAVRREERAVRDADDAVVDRAQAAVAFVDAS